MNSPVCRRSGNDFGGDRTGLGESAWIPLRSNKRNLDVDNHGAAHLGYRLARSTMRVVTLILAFATFVSAAEYDIVDFGATSGDQADDTTAIENALSACARDGGGTVVIPPGTFILSRRNNESPILEVPPNTTIRGEGAASILKYDSDVNQSNFWRMIGAPTTGTKNVTIRDLHLDGSNTHTEYTAGAPEHNAGIFFYDTDDPIENVVVRNIVAENFSGDCIAFSQGCRGVLVRDCSLRNYLRQGVQMAGGNGARDYRVTGCRDLDQTITPGGSTIHVEHARGLSDVVIENNYCRNSILVSEANGIIVRRNIVEGRIVANANIDLLIADNVVRPKPDTSATIQIGYAKGATIRGNVIHGTENTRIGIYCWGMSKFNDQPSENVWIGSNQVAAKETAILLNGTRDVRISANQLSAPDSIIHKRTTFRAEER